MPNILQHISVNMLGKAVCAFSLCLNTATLEIRNSSQHNGLNVPDASMVLVSSTEDVLQLMNIGQRNRAFGCTALNERSSRSHSVLTVHVKGTDLSVGAILRGCLHLIDLAGSERVDKSLATGDRLKEAQHINKSLSALGDVIAALAQKSPHVPYRNSKLTQLLQDSLGGQAKTLMFVHVSPDHDSYGETISTLKFAERVAVVELGACCSNKESGEVRDLKNQIAFLKDALNKKERELERLHRDSREKGTVSIQERAQVRSGAQPIEHTSVSLPGHDTSLPGYYGFHGQEHAAKQRASKLPRQTLSSDSRTSSLNSDLSCQAPSIPLQGNGNPSTNKNRITSNESRSRALSRHDRLSISSRSVIVHTHLHHYYGGSEMECSDETDELSEAGGSLQNGQTKHSEKKESFKVPRLHPIAPSNIIPSLRSQLKSGQGSTEVSSCTMELEDDGETSDYSEAELWHKDSSKAADEHRKVDFLSTAESKRRQDREKRFQSRLAATAAVEGQQQAHRHSVSYSPPWSSFTIDSKRLGKGFA